MPRIPLYLYADSVKFSAVRAQGAGGQNANKVSHIEIKCLQQGRKQQRKDLFSYIISMKPLASIRRILHMQGLLPILLWLLSCSSPQREGEDSLAASPLPNSLCDSACDSSPLSSPVKTETGGYGAVTTYGDVWNLEFSSGGACNYGQTQILQYAAAHVDLQSGDAEGLWQGGRACGDCYQVRVGSDSGWRTTVVRIVDKCPDAGCGIDLGGAPAKSLMGAKPGRYTGEWERVSCSSQADVSDGPRVLHVKEGSNAWWSVVQVRNGPSAVQSISWTSLDGSQSGEFLWASEAENYWKVPNEVLTRSDTVGLRIEFRNGIVDSLRILGKELALENADYLL